MAMFRPAKPESFQYSPTHRAKSRKSYPTFLSVSESIQLQAQWAWQGFYDAFRWNVVYRTTRNDLEIRGNIYKSVLLNTLSLISIYTFELLLQPLVRNQERWVHRNMGWFYHVLWLLPIVGTSFYLNSKWVNIIAKRTFALQHGGRAAAQPHLGYTGMLKAIATSAYCVVMVFTSLLVSFGLGIIPYAGPVITFIFFCWIDSFVWVTRGMSLSRRVRHLEERWAYYLAFGLPSTSVCMLGSGLASAALFALIYPAYVILAMHAHPQPLDPYNPLPPSSSETDVIRHPSPFIPIRIPVFGLVIWLNDSIVKVLSIGSAKPAESHKGPRRSRAFSDTSESVEQGESHELDTKAPAPQRQVRQPRERVILSRRKAD